MKFTPGLLAGFALALALAWPAGDARAQACNVVDGHTHGCLATIMSGPVSSVSGAAVTKRGRACAFNVLALVAAGDVRISTAKRNGGISEVATVDYEAFELVPYYRIFSRYCTVVSGR